MLQLDVKAQASFFMYLQGEDTGMTQLTTNSLSGTFVGKYPESAAAAHIVNAIEIFHEFTREIINGSSSEKGDQ